MQEKPVLGITMGDPGSVGPEISVKALAHAGIYEQCRPLMIGDAKVMEQGWYGGEYNNSSGSRCGRGTLYRRCY